MKNPENNRTTAESAGEFYGLEQEMKTGQQRKSKIFLYRDNRYKFKRQSCNQGETVDRIIPVILHNDWLYSGNLPISALNDGQKEKSSSNSVLQHNYCLVEE